MSATIALFALLVVGFVAVSARAGRAHVSAPMVFMFAGFAFANTDHYDLPGSAIKTVAEVTLALLLFHGAAELRPRHLRRDAAITARLLLIAFPLTVAGTCALVLLILPGLDPWLAVALAAALAPTDSALSPAAVLDPAVPARIRRVLSLESGLNDGLATPVVLFAIAAAAGTTTADDQHGAAKAVLAVVIGVAFGILAGVAAGRVLRAARRRGWVEDSLVPVAVLAVGLLAYYGAAMLGGNGFMAAFVAGTAYAASAGSPSVQADRDLEFTRLSSALLGAAAWMLFGAATSTHLAELVHWQSVLIAVASLTLLRMAPVALSLAGLGLGVRSSLFVGWFGPRGLPSVVFALIASDALGNRSGAATLVATIAATVTLSVLAHGLTAPPMSAAYGAWARRLTRDG